MEDLMCALQKSTLGDQNISNRTAQYKNKGRNGDFNRDRRRSQLLEEYKRKRHILLNEKRGLINDEFNESEDWMDWQENGDKKRRRKWINYNCKNQLMLSEWLLDHPCDLDTAWTCVVCPEGQRTLVIAKKGCTRAYHKSGYLVAKFKSILPNGAPNNIVYKNKDIIILDCIWKASSKKLFCLDVLHWNNQPLLDCDAQFRLYWLKSKLTEVRNFNPAGDGIYDVFIPPHCSVSNLTETLSENNPSEVDGVLFFHNSAPYVTGLTPLVGWLKPYMLPERLGLDVPAEYMALKPNDYVDLEQWVSKVSHAHARKSKKGNKTPAKGEEEMKSMNADS